MQQVLKIVKRDQYNVSRSDQMIVAQFLLQFQPDHEIALNVLTNQSITTSPVDTTVLMIDAKKYIEMY